MPIRYPSIFYNLFTASRNILVMLKQVGFSATISSFFLVLLINHNSLEIFKYFLILQVREFIVIFVLWTNWYLSHGHGRLSLGFLLFQILKPNSQLKNKELSYKLPSKVFSNFLIKIFQKLWYNINIFDDSFKLTFCFILCIRKKCKNIFKCN